MKSKPKEKKPFHLVLYVEDCSPKMKKFLSIEKMDIFIKKFKASSPSPQDGYWVDHVITDIHGQVTSHD